MSEPADNGLNCDRAHDLLVDLACEELNPELEAAVRSHADGCGRCGPELAKLTRVMSVAEALPLAEPSKAVEERILRAARESLAARAGGTQAREPVRQVSEYRSWFSRISEWALSPQVAMASVLLLMVGIGLYALPIGRDQEPVAFEATPDERSPAPSPAASATAVPAAEPEPLAEERAAKEQAAELNKALREAKGDATSGRKSRARPAGKSGGGSLDDFGGLSDSKNASGGGLGEGSATEASSYKKSESKAAPGANVQKQGASAFAPAPPPATAPSKPIAPASKVAQPKEAPSAQPQAASADREMEEAPQQPIEKGTESAQRALNDGIAAARKGAYAQAVSLLSPVANQGPESLRPSARLWLARSLRGQGKCTEAVRYYAPMVQLGSASDEVLSEAADCYERNGDTAVAGKLRSRLHTQEVRE